MICIFALPILVSKTFHRNPALRLICFFFFWSCARHDHQKELRRFLLGYGTSVTKWPYGHGVHGGSEIFLMWNRPRRPCVCVFYFAFFVLLSLFLREQACLADEPAYVPSIRRHVVLTLVVILQRQQRRLGSRLLWTTLDLRLAGRGWLFSLTENASPTGLLVFNLFLCLSFPVCWIADGRVQECAGHSHDRQSHPHNHHVHVRRSLLTQSQILFC